MADEGVVEMTDQWRSPTNEELFQEAKPFTTLEEFVTWEDPFESDEEHELFLAWLYDQRHRCANCTLWPNGLPPHDDRAGRDEMARLSWEGVVPVTENRQLRSTSRGESSPTNEELERQAGGPITSIEELYPGFDLFGSDEEHEAFLEDLYESRRHS